MNNLSDIAILRPENVKIVVYITLVIITIYFGCFLFRFTKNTGEKVERYSRFDPKGDKYEEMRTNIDIARFVNHFLIPLFLYLFLFLLVISALYITFLS